MFRRHFSHQIDAYLDLQLLPPEAERVALHLLDCAACRSQHDEGRRTRSLLHLLTPETAPDEIWTSLITSPQPIKRKPPVWTFAAPAAAAAAVACLTLAFWLLYQRSHTGWEVLQQTGSPSLGEWVETDSRSSATIKVGDLGTLQIEPNTRARLRRTRSAEHRMTLDHGGIHVSISAPPRLFFVDTPSGTAVDLGCEYSLTTDENGIGVLRVTKGWVAFQWNNLESLVPAGASCRTRGIPYFDDASDPFKEAIDAFGTASNLDVILKEARVRDTLSLWHLLFRLDLADRARILDRITTLTPPPAGLSLEKALALDAGTLQQLREALAWTW